MQNSMPPFTHQKHEAFPLPFLESILQFPQQSSYKFELLTHQSILDGDLTVDLPDDSLLLLVAHNSGHKNPKSYIANTVKICP